MVTNGPEGPANGGQGSTGRPAGTGRAGGRGRPQPQDGDAAAPARPAAALGFPVASPLLRCPRRALPPL